MNLEKRKDARTNLEHECARRDGLRRDARAQGAYAHNTGACSRDALDGTNVSTMHVRDTRDDVQRVLQGQTSIEDEEGKYKVLT